MENNTSTAWLWLGRGFRFLLVLVILAVAIGISYYWMTHKPKATRRPPEAQAILVEVTPVLPKTQPVILEAMGTVIPSRTIQLAFEVAGKIVEVSPDFVPGGRFKAGQEILHIEPKDYNLAVMQKTSDLEKATAALKVSQADHEEAQLAFEQSTREKVRYEGLFKKGIATETEQDDAITQYNLSQAKLKHAEAMVIQTKAAIDAATSALEQAKLDLKRTIVVSPFNAMVESRSVNLGSHVNAGTTLASLVGTDEYWVQVSIPTDELRWIDIPNGKIKTGSTVRIFCESAWGSGVSREGNVKGLMTQLETQGRMAMLIVAVKDPLQLKLKTGPRHQLILNSYVQVEIDGRELANVIRIPRTALRDGNKVWLYSPDNTLDIRDVKIAWSGDEEVYVTNSIVEGDLLITSDLATPVKGIALRTADSPTSQASEDSKGDK